MLNKMLLLAILFSLAGCATSYESSGLTGGYSQSSGFGRMEKIEFSSNGYIAAEKVQQFALYRCAVWKNHGPVLSKRPRC